MNTIANHTFHIPVMGLGYTVDTPLKVARFGISSVVSIIEDELLEQMRGYHSEREGEAFTSIPVKDTDHRAKRITAYLDMLSRLVNKQVTLIRALPFEKGNDLVKYFEMLPEESGVKNLYREMQALEEGPAKHFMQQQLRHKITAGKIDVNIMTKVDRTIYSEAGEALPAQYSDAMAALRGFANSELDAGIVFSAGLNPRLYGYLESFEDFFPDRNGYLKKRVILKVSDFRSALIQGKFLAKKGIWISEFRIESGLNCGGHAFATEGLLLGPIMEEFKNRREELQKELSILCNTSLLARGKYLLTERNEIKISVQGGIGTSREDRFLRGYYHINSTGWGSPFLLVPEATNVDNETLLRLVNAKKEDYYLSYASPLGVPFNNFRKSTSEEQRKLRITKGRPGSPCYRKFLVSNTEFTERPICTASRQYQRLKLISLEKQGLSKQALNLAQQEVMEKDCLCEGLGTGVLLRDSIPHPKKLKAVTICPGPNLAYFSRTASLEEMVGHIYGRTNLLNTLVRPNLFINELNLYIDFLKNEIARAGSDLTEKKVRYLKTFRSNLLKGISYYKDLFSQYKNEFEAGLPVLMEQLFACGQALNGLPVQYAE